MTAQLCPSCGEKGFVWSIDEDVSPYTQWNCLECSYSAEENEKLESVCDECKTKYLIYLKSNNEYYKFCTNCQTKTKAKSW